MKDMSRGRKELESRIYWDVVSRRPENWTGTLRKMIAEPNYAISVVRKHLHPPGAARLDTTDRQVLENQIFPHYLNTLGLHKVLFVGCDADTAHYEENYFSNVSFVTLEPNVAHRGFGAVHHVATTLQHVGDYFASEHFDLIICNGVFGWGLDEAADCEAAFAQCYECLQPDGHLLLGWNDVPRRAPFALETISSLARFRKFECPPFATWRYLTDTVYRHTFDFYVK